MDSVVNAGKYDGVFRDPDRDRVRARLARARKRLPVTAEVVAFGDERACASALR
jgi:hypothetical protein